MYKSIHQKYIYLHIKKTQKDTRNLTSWGKFPHFKPVEKRFDRLLYSRDFTLFN
ncbi:hypothetical protein Hdeb2414_s0009g00299331 [Helianthus debilis subsp. tardiflorus]